MSSAVPAVFEGHINAANLRFAFVVARFNHFVVDRLVEGALDAVVRHGGSLENVAIYKAPGSFELPVLAARVAERGGIDALIGLGAVIRGATPHFDYVAGEAVRGISSVGLKHTLPVAFGILTVDTIEQAIERAGTKAGNKGWEAAVAAIEMANLFARLRPEAGR